ncbi:MAG: hypothetical protein P8175_10095, partial [Deltaproteobacteria bacterium]
MKVLTPREIVSELDTYI